jgi:hypothetical protein
MAISAVIVSFLVYRSQRIRSKGRTTWGTVFQIGYVGTLLAGLLFMIQIGPEMLSALGSTDIQFAHFGVFAKDVLRQGGHDGSSLPP